MSDRTMANESWREINRDFRKTQDKSTDKSAAKKEKSSAGRLKSVVKKPVTKTQKPVVKSGERLLFRESLRIGQAEAPSKRPHAMASSAWREHFHKEGFVTPSAPVAVSQGPPKPGPMDLESAGSVSKRRRVTFAADNPPEEDLDLFVPLNVTIHSKLDDSAAPDSDSIVLESDSPGPSLTKRQKKNLRRNMLKAKAAAAAGSASMVATDKQSTRPASEGASVGASPLGSSKVQSGPAVFTSSAHGVAKVGVKSVNFGSSGGLSSKQRLGPHVPLSSVQGSAKVEVKSVNFGSSGGLASKQGPGGSVVSGFKPSVDTSSVNSGSSGGIASGQGSTSTQSTGAFRCILCSYVGNDSCRVHLTKHHLPWYLRPSTACWTCQINANAQSALRLKHSRCWSEFGDPELAFWLAATTGYLYQLALALGFTNPQILWAKVITSKWYDQDSSRNNNLSVSDTTLWEILDGYLQSPTLPTVYEVCPPSTSAAMLDTGVLLPLLTKLDKSTRDKLQNEVMLLDHAGYIISKEVAMEPVVGASYSAIDAHCHIHKLLFRQQVGTGPLHQQLEEVRAISVSRRIEPILFHVDHMISNMVHKHCRAALTRYLREDIPPSCSFTVGYHPTDSEEVDAGRLLSFTSHDRVVGIGECGLDFHRIDAGDHVKVGQTLRLQLDKLRPQLQVAQQTGLPLVLHLRGHGKIAESWIHERAINELQAVVSKTHRVHVHCFTGDLAMCKAWIKAFPNVIFGVAIPDMETIATLRQAAELRRIVLESDAPFLIPNEIREHYEATSMPNSPWYLHHTLDVLALAFNLPARAVASIMAKTTRGFYARV